MRQTRGVDGEGVEMLCWYVLSLSFSGILNRTVVGEWTASPLVDKRMANFLSASSSSALLPFRLLTKIAPGLPVVQIDELTAEILKMSQTRTFD